MGPPAQRDRAPVAAGLGALAVVVLITLSVGLGATGLVVGALGAVGGPLALALATRGDRPDPRGRADAVTLGRATLMVGVAALVADGAAVDERLPVLVGIAVVALVLDAVDGWVARRRGEVSALGARLDMEVDAALILVLCVAAAAHLGPWVVLIGALRYLFVGAGRVTPRLRAPLPESTARKAVAATQGIALVAVLVLAPAALGLAALVAAAALAALLWSFGRDVVWLLRPGPTIRP